MTHEQLCILFILYRVGPRSRDVLFAATNQGRPSEQLTAPDAFDGDLSHLVATGLIALDRTSFEGGTDLYRLLPAGDAAMCAVVA